MAPLLTQSLCLIQNSNSPKAVEMFCRMQAVEMFCRMQAVKADDTYLEAVKYTVDAAFILQW